MPSKPNRPILTDENCEVLAVEIRALAEEYVQKRFGDTLDEETLNLFVGTILECASDLEFQDEE